MLHWSKVTRVNLLVKRFNKINFIYLIISAGYFFNSCKFDKRKQCAYICGMGFIRISEFAKRHGVSRQAIHKAIGRKQIKKTTIGGVAFVDSRQKYSPKTKRK